MPRARKFVIEGRTKPPVTGFRRLKMLKATFEISAAVKQLVPVQPLNWLKAAAIASLERLSPKTLKARGRIVRVLAVGTSPVLAFVNW